MITKYYISFNGSTYTQIYLSNEPIVKIEQEAGEIFFRRKVDKLKIGALKNGSIYTTLESYWFDPTKFGVEINYKINIDGYDKFLYYDTIRAGNLNTQNKIYECTPDPDDDYKPIMRLYNKKFDNRDGKLFLLDTAPHYPKLDTTNNFVNSTPAFAAFADTLSSVTYQNTLTGAAYASKALNAAAINTTVISVVISNLVVTSGAEPRMRLVNAMGGTGYSNQITLTANGRYEMLVSGIGYTLIEFSQVNLGASSAGSFHYEIYPSFVAADAGGSSVYDVLDRVINHASYFNLAYDIVSTILWNDPLESDAPASIDTYITANPTKDYVIEGTALWNNIGLYRVDNFTTAKDDNIELCLKDVMDILKAKRFWWYIDNNGKFRIEHDKYFRSYDTFIDLTSSTYSRFKPEVDRKIYTYELNGYNQINLIENNTANTDWLDVRITYDPKLTGDNVQDVRGNFTTDIKNIIDNSTTISSGGLVLLRLDANDCIPLDETTPGTFYPNGKLSPMWIAVNYMGYFAEASIGTVKDTLLNIIHVKESLKQTGVRFHDNPDLTWKKPFAMAIGSGWLTSAEYNPETGFWIINVGYDPYQISIPTVPEGTMGSITADSTEVTADSTLITVDNG